MSHYRATVLGTLPGEQFNFGMHLSGAGGDVTGAQAAWHSAIDALWTDATDGIQGLFATSVSIVGDHVAELDALTGKQIDAAAGTFTLPGTNGTETLPNEVACAVSFHGAKPVRNQRGRSFMPPLAVNQLLNGRFIAAATARLLDGWVLAINQLQGAGFAPEIYHPDHTGTPIVEVLVGNVPDAQRRRRDKLVEVYVSAGV